MKRIAVAIVTVVAFLAILVAATPFIVPDSFLKNRIAAQISAWTGRAVTIAGEPTLSLYPTLTITVADLAVSNPAEIGDDAFMTAAGVRATMPLLPLLFGRTEFDQFELTDPRVRLIVDKNGRTNWDLADSTIVEQAETLAAAPAPAAQPDPPPVEPGATNLPPPLPPPDIRIGHLRIVNGTVIYDDLAAERREEMTAVNLELIWPSASAPARASGSLVWRGEQIDFNGALATPLVLIAGGKSPLRLAAASTALRIALRGDASGGGARFDGWANVTTPSLRRAITWFGTPLQPASTLGAAAIDGLVSVRPDSIAFENAALEFDGNRADGDIAVGFSTPRPLVTATLTTDRLDLSAYIEGARSDLTASGSWLVVPTGLGFAGAFDADIGVAAGELLIFGMHIDNAAGRAKLSAGAVDLTIDDGQLAGGNVKARVEARMIDADLVANATAEAINVSAGPALGDAAGITALSGTGRATLAIGSRGKTWGEFARAVTGSLDVAIERGLLSGFDVPKLAVELADPLALPVSPGDARTVFSQLTGSIDVTEGDFVTDDLRMEGDGFAVTIAGRGSILNGLVDARGTIAAGSDTVPVTITGRWRAPAVARDPGPDSPEEPTEPAAGEPTGG